MEKLPIEIKEKMFRYVSHPISDLIRPHINEYNRYGSYLHYRRDIMDFTEFMMINALYFDQTSKIHIRFRKKIINYFNWN